MIKVLRLKIAELYERRHEEWKSIDVASIRDSLVHDIWRLAEEHRGDKVYFRDDDVDYLAVMKQAAPPTCMHEMGDEQCLVGVIGEDRPHCVKCRHCGQMVPWEHYGEADRFWFRKRRRDEKLAGSGGSTIDPD